MATNLVVLTGRLTDNPTVRYGAQSQTAVARFNLAVDRGKKDGKDLGTDFPSIVAFGKTAENIEKYCKKGSLVLIMGRLQTGSYEKDGRKIYTTEVLLDRVEFLEKKSDSAAGTPAPADAAPASSGSGDPLGGVNLDPDDIPF